LTTIHTVASIGSDGTARIFAENFDDGSFDNCGIRYMKVRKKTDSCGSEAGDYIYNDQFYNDYVDFCCAEVGDTVRVQFLVEDIHDNVNVVWVEVTLNDKLFPVVVAPIDLTVSCNHGFYFDDLSSFGEVVLNDEPRKPIIINDGFNNGTVGLDGYAVDNCFVEVEEVVEMDLDCGKGTITRTFIATDNNGMTDQDVQVITVADADPFTEDQIIWPGKITIEGCTNVNIDTSETGYPTYIDKNCAKLAAEYTDKVFQFADGACLAIHREWEVLDWCQYDPQTGIGLWNYIQVIYVENNTDPIFSEAYQDTTVCIYGECEGLVELEVDATDDCTEDLFYKWRVDFDLDGFYDDEGLGNKISEIWEPGRYQVYWSVEDLCGNVAIEKYFVTVQDCKPPTPYCYSGLATAIMPQGGEVQLWASDYDIGSFDNCTDTSSLKVSFSKDTSDTFLTVTCEMMSGGVSQLIPLKVWVTDEAGNQDFCSVEVRVNDNFDTCPDSEIGYIDVDGEVVSYQNALKLEDVEMRLEAVTDFQMMEFTDNDGAYAFQDVPAGNSFRIRASLDDEHRQGVTTLDIILIQKHILGLQYLDDPYKLIAADVSNSGSISGLDLIQIRKLILGLNKTFPKNSSWRFVDASYEFPDPSKPWGFQETVDFDIPNSDINDADLIAVKIGDVNNSYQGSQKGNLSHRSSSYPLEIDDYDFKTGEHVDVTIRVEEGADIEGFQMSLDYDPDKLRFMSMGKCGIELREKHWQLDEVEGRIYISYDKIAGLGLDLGQCFQNIKFQALGEGQLSDGIKLNKGAILPEIYLKSGEVRFLDLRFSDEHRSQESDPAAFVLKQNKPNPFLDLTRIDFVLPSDEEVEFTVFDLSGRKIISQQGEYSRGRHQLLIRKQDLPKSGVYYYQVRAGNYEETKRLVFIH